MYISISSYIISIKRLKLTLYKRVKSFLLSFILITSLITLKLILRVINKLDF